MHSRKLSCVEISFFSFLLSVSQSEIRNLSQRMAQRRSLAPEDVQKGAYSALFKQRLTRSPPCFAKPCLSTFERLWASAWCLCCLRTDFSLVGYRGSPCIWEALTADFPVFSAQCNQSLPKSCPQLDKVSLAPGHGVCGKRRHVKASVIGLKSRVVHRVVYSPNPVSCPRP